MPSENKTKYLKLNQWAETDRPIRNDFNSDNSIIDSAVGGHITDSQIHITAEEKELLNDFMSVNMYVGTGESAQTINLTKAVRAVIVYAKDKPLTQFDSTSEKTKVYSAAGYRASGSSAGLSISASATAFTVTQGEDSSGNILCLNENGVQYKVISFR